MASTLVQATSTLDVDTVRHGPARCHAASALFNFPVLFRFMMSVSWTVSPATPKASPALRADALTPDGRWEETEVVRRPLLASAHSLLPPATCELSFLTSRAERHLGGPCRR